MLFSSCFRSIIESKDRRGSFWLLKRRTYQTLAWLRWDKKAETNITSEAVPFPSSIELRILQLQPSLSCHVRRDVGGLKQPCRSESDRLGSQASRSRIEQQGNGKQSQYSTYYTWCSLEFYAPLGAHSRRTDSPLSVSPVEDTRTIKIYGPAPWCIPIPSRCLPGCLASNRSLPLHQR
jgi:hypothetical protein